jgi:hypothetical protein
MFNNVCFKMTKVEENIFDYDPKEKELENFNLSVRDKEAYLLSTSSQKRLNDLHFLFFLRDDGYNYDRIMEKQREVIAISWGLDTLV